jgi:signal transduction histidine kinase
LVSDTILALALDLNGDLWVGTNRGLNRLHNGKVQATYTTHDGLSGAEVRALSVDGQGTLWAGTNNGLDRFNGSSFVSADWIPRSKTNGIVSVAGGRTVRLFVSTDGPGFYYLRDNAVTNYPLDVIRPVDCYYLDHVRHTAWLGTLGSGLLRWENGTITHIRVKDGLYDNRIYSILKDDRSNFWLASSKGIFRISEKDLEDFAAGRIHTVTSMPFSTGQLRFECRAGVQPAAWRTRDGRLWFSTTNGLVVVDPNHLITDPIPPPVQITAMLVNGERIDPHANLELKPFEKNVEIRYSGLSFVSPEKVSFRYILDGYDKSWTDAGPRREAFFTNLPPGNFNFEVMARNADGIWSTGAASLKFVVEPRFYQRRWFLPLMAALLALAIAAGYRMRVRRLRTRFQLVLAERGRIARELHDTLLQGLSGITMQLQALWTKLPASREKQMLQEIIKDAGACSTEARRSLWDLRANATGDIEFSGKLAKLARDSVAGKPISLVLDLQPVSLSAFPEKEYQLLRIAQECISNTLLHASASRLEIRLSLSGHDLHLALEDNGIGFHGDSGRGRAGHFGLMGMRERAEEIGANLTVTSAPGFGSQVSIWLPLTAAGASEATRNALLERQTI